MCRPQSSSMVLVQPVLIKMQEKDRMLRYVGEEVDRVKGLFEQKEARLTGERDSAKQAAAQLADELKDKAGQVERMGHQLQHLPGLLEVGAAAVSCLHLRLMAHILEAGTRVPKCMLKLHVRILLQFPHCREHCMLLSICIPCGYKAGPMAHLCQMLVIAECAKIVSGLFSHNEHC